MTKIPKDQIKTIHLIETASLILFRANLRSCYTSQEKTQEKKLSTVCFIEELHIIETTGNQFQLELDAL